MGTHFVRVLVVFFLLCTSAWAAEATSETVVRFGQDGTVLVVIDWTASASGTHADYAIDADTVSELWTGGYYIYAVVTIPGTGTAPAANYDLTIDDDTYGYDLLGGNLANRSDTDTEKVTPDSVAEPCTKGMTVTFDNLGNDGEGQILIFCAKY
jgi:hypothetical protein